MFSTRLKELRKSKKLTQEQLAAIIGVERSSIGKYEGKSEIIPSPAVLNAIADFFNVTIDYLLGRDSEQKKNPDTAEDAGDRTLYEVVSSLTPEYQERLLELALLYQEKQRQSRESE